MKKLSFPNMPIGGFDYLLLGRQALEILNNSSEAHPFFQGQILWMGFPIKFIEYFRRERKHGKSRWTMGKKITYLIDGLMAYSFLPIRLVSVLGIVIACMGFLYAVIVFFARICWGNPVTGWAPLMIVLLVLGGFQMLTLGVFGEYMWRILAQVRMREPYIVERIWDETEGESAPLGENAVKLQS
ncbi:MAG: hypothetical protein EOM12_18365 [Verrucomicrobiae bacterium]|nr:hypothetical protein [Verrucomicrobiae bacterium]